MNKKFSLEFQNLYSTFLLKYNIYAYSKIKYTLTV